MHCLFHYLCIVASSFFRYRPSCLVSLSANGVVTNNAGVKNAGDERAGGELQRMRVRAERVRGRNENDWGCLKARR
jgi:hypothetical protein